MDPTGKVALVTGGANGIGLAICKELLEEKVKGVAICDNDEELGRQRLSELEEKYGPGRIVFIKTDVRSYEQFEEAFKHTITTFGTLDIVVNNAGIFNDVEWEKEVDINLNGVIRGMMLAFKYMGKNNENKRGVVVNISSTMGLEPLDVIPIYCGTKHGVVGLTRAFGTQLHFERTGVRVVAMCPGFTTSSIGPKKGTLLDENWESTITSIVNQPVEYVSRAVLQMIRDAQNGSLWVSENEKTPYQVTIPPLQSLRNK